MKYVSPNRQRGFTVFELLIVLAVIAILLSIVMVSFKRARQGSTDDVAIADLNLVSLALEQYRGQCKVYPDKLDRSANNNHPALTGSTCITFGDLLPAQVDLAQFQYQALRSSGAASGSCTAYHINVVLDSDSQSRLAGDSDFNGSIDLASCLPGGAGHVGHNDDPDGYYDIKFP